jgi:hypothetical protein
MALRKSLQTAVTATTAAGTNSLKTTAIVNGVIDATFEALSKQSPMTPGQQQAITVLKADALTNVATIRIGIYGA